MSFSTPEWFICLLVIPIVLTLGILAWRRRDQGWKAIVADRLKSQLTRTRSPKRLFIALGFSMAGLLLLVTSLAMPENGEEFIETRQEGRNILLCFDISQSMLTPDSGSGSRLAAAQGAALEIAERFPSDRIGLLVFSGKTQLSVPLTIDHSFLKESITQLDPIDIPLGGSDLAQAIRDSTRLLNKTGQRNNIMVVLSDGEDHSSGIESAAANAASRGVFIYALGIGSEKGDFIRDPRGQGGFFYDRSGNRVLSQLKEESLRRIADQTEGIYTRAEGGNFMASLEQAVSKMDRFEEEGGHQRIAKPVYQWFLFPGILFLVSGFILQRLPVRAPAMAILLAFWSFSSPVRAEGNVDQLLDELSRIIQSSESDSSEKALRFRKAAENATGNRKAQFNLAAGAADYKQKDWSAAASSFGEALLTEDHSIRQKAHFALANSLFYKGRELSTPGEQIKTWNGAISHFEEALKLDDQKSTRENLEFLRRLIKQKEEEQQQEKQQENKDQQNKDDQKNENEDPDQPEDQKSEAPPQPQDQPDQNNPSDPANQNKEQQQPDPPKPEDEQNNSGSEGKPEDGSETQQQPQNGEPPEEGNEQKVAQSQANEANPESTETPLERARRILREQADFGGKPPKARRRAYRRPEKDW